MMLRHNRFRWQCILVISIFLIDYLTYLGDSFKHVIPCLCSLRRSSSHNAVNLQKRPLDSSFPTTSIPATSLTISRSNTLEDNVSNDHDDGLFRVATLKCWLEERGAFISPKVEVEYIPGMGFGLKAIGKVNPYEVVISIPREQCLSAMGPSAIDDIALKLCQERMLGRQSAWWPYLDALPTDASFLPCLWPAADLELIEGSSIAIDAAAMKQSWIDSYEEVVAATGLQIDQQLWFWARAMVQSRGYSFRTDNKEEPVVPTVQRHYKLQQADEAAAARVAASGGNDAALQRQRRAAAAPPQGSAIVAALMGVPDYQKPDKDTPQLTVMFPFIDLANHHDVKSSTVAAGNGIEYPESSIVLKSRHRYYPGSAIFISYGDLSFQQKALSFGWIDQSYHSNAGATDSKSAGEQTEYTDNSEGGAHCITPILIPKELISFYSSKGGDDTTVRVPQVEIKTRISLHKRTGNSKGQPTSKKHLDEFNEELAKAIKAVDDVTMNTVVTMMLLRNALEQQYERALNVEALNNAELWLLSQQQHEEDAFGGSKRRITKCKEALYIAHMELDAIELILNYFKQ